MNPNMVPLGGRRRYGPTSAAPPPAQNPVSAYNNNPTTDGYDSSSRKRRSASPPSQPTGENGFTREGRPRRKKNRWGDSTDATTGAAGVPTVLPSTLAPEQLEAVVIHMRLDEISKKLKTGDVVPPEGMRSPSPEPIYGADGKRVNTREWRYRKKLEDERHRLIQEAMRKIPDFRPPSDYRRPTKIVEKVWIPVRDFPEINFIGLLIGPRGNTLKKMEGESGAKIAIRGKGSVKEGKRAENPQPGDDDDLHCQVTADSEEKIQRAIKAINRVIETAASVPEGQNELKRQQLRELASLNGTLRDDENQLCSNCGNPGHRKYDCPERANFTNSIICRICGGVGHMARDCMQKNNPDAMAQAKERDHKLDAEYASFMQELDGGRGGSAGPDRSGGSNPWGRTNSYNSYNNGPSSAASTGSTPWSARPSHSGPPSSSAMAPPPPPPGGFNAPPPPPPAYNYNMPPSAGPTDSANAPAAPGYSSTEMDAATAAYYAAYGYDYSAYYAAAYGQQAATTQSYGYNAPPPSTGAGINPPPPPPSAVGINPPPPAPSAVGINPPPPPPPSGY